MFKILFLVVLLVATVQHGVDAQNKVTKTHPAARPKYLEMINAATTALKERGVSSREAIVKYIVNKYYGANTHIKAALKRGIVSRKLVRGTGASGSFKLADKAKAEKPAKQKAVAKKEPAKKPVAKKSAKKAPKKAPAKKPVAKKSPAKKPVAKKVAKKSS